MDPQTKGLLLGSLSSAAALTLGYLVASSLKTPRGGEQQVTIPTQSDHEDQQHIEEAKTTPTPGTGKHIETPNFDPSKPSVILLGDVGGTNIRLVLRKVYLDEHEKPSEDIKEANFNSQKVKSFEEAVELFLEEFANGQYWPQAAVVGVAGPVDNNMVELTNVPHWSVVDGESLSQTLDIPKFTLINDFAAAGYGILTLKERDYIRMTDVIPHEGAVKIVLGPGTGLGQGILCKGLDSKYYDIFPSEGGHVEFSVRNQEDFDLLKFAEDFLEHSNNVENLRAKGHVSRISIERLCAGPALPLIYDFIAKRNPTLERVLETQGGKSFDELTSTMIVEAGVKKRDPLCLKVVEKFTEIFAVEVGNTALKTLPYGGIYLTGGVTAGIQEYLLHSDTFLENFYAKGRQEKKMRKMPIFIVKPEIQLGLQGAEECARRILSAKK